MFISDYRTRIGLFSKYSGVPAFIVDNLDQLVFSSFGIRRGESLPIIGHLQGISVCSDCPRLVVFNGLELYGIINLELRGGANRLIVGPVLSIKPNAEKNLKLLSFSAYFPEETVRRYVKNIPLMTMTKFVQYLELLYYSLANRSCRFDEIADKKIILEMVPENLAISIPDTIFAGDFSNINPYFQDVLKAYELIKTGDVPVLERHLSETLMTRSVISQSERENYTVFVAAAAFFAKAALDAGLEFKDVETISSAFIKYAESITSANDFYSLMHRLLIGYATRVHEDKMRKQNPPAVKKAIDYIETYLHYPLTLEDIAEYVNLSRAYFSQLFSKVMGISLQSYINKRKVQEAEQHLKFTSMSIKEISELMAFCSQSYFTEVFKAVTGTTPIAFRKRAKTER